MGGDVKGGRRQGGSQADGCAARGEAATLHSLANTARLLDKNPALLNLRLLQALESGSGNTLILHLGTAPSGATPVGAQIIDA